MKDRKSIVKAEDPWVLAEVEGLELLAKSKMAKLPEHLQIAARALAAVERTTQAILLAGERRKQGRK